MILHQKILDTIESDMKTILSVDGFYTDLGQNVYVNRSNKIISSANENAINIVDVHDIVTTALTEGMINKFNHQLLIELTIFFKDPGDTAIIRQGLIDVQSIIKNNLNWDSYALNTLPPEGSEFIEMVFDQEENIIIAAKINFIVLFRTDQWNED